MVIISERVGLQRYLGVSGFTVFDGKTKFDLHSHLGTPSCA